MNLWIRSQDREILRINPELEIYEDNNKDVLVIDTKGSTDYYVAKVLGKYKTKERALEVLDEIINLMLPTKAGFDENGEYSCKGCFANKDMMYYEMPEE